MISEKILYKICDENNDMEFCHGINYFKKYVYGTNCSVFAKVKYDFQKQYNGKMILQNGELFDINKHEFAKINSRIDEYLKNKERDTIDICQVINRLSLISIIKKYADIDLDHIYIGGYLFGVYSLKTFCNICDELFIFHSGISYVNNVHALIAKDIDNVVIVACCYDNGHRNYIDYKTGILENAQISLSDVLKKMNEKLKKIDKAISKADTEKEKKELGREKMEITKDIEIISKIIEDK